MLSNAENEEWNLAHNGCRVPINDTGIQGAPAALSSADPEWERGSLNKAVRETYLLSNEIPLITKDMFDRGVVDLKTLRSYVTRDMLYGFGGDARGRLPGDMMSFRGYPTPVIVDCITSIFQAGVTHSINVDGLGVTEQSKWLTVQHIVKLKYKLPYDVTYTLTTTLTSKGVTTNPFVFEVTIPKNSHYIKFYKTPDSEQLISTVEGKLYFPINTRLDTENVLFEVALTNVVQAPYYGILSNSALIIPSTIYNPIPSPVGYFLGAAYKSPNIPNVACMVNTCNKIKESYLFTATPELEPYLVYMRSGETLTVNTKIYSDSLCTLPHSGGSYVFAKFLYTDDTTSTKIYEVKTYVRVSGDGTIYEIYQDLGSGYDDCWASGVCS